MRPFRVWLRPLGEACRLRVEGRDNAVWLRDRVTASLNVRCNESSNNQDSNGIITLVVRYGPQVSHVELYRLLDRLRELEVMCQPA